MYIYIYTLSSFSQETLMVTGNQPFFGSQLSYDISTPKKRIGSRHF